MCPYDHDTGDCRYHNEAIEDGTWDRHFHKWWAEYGRKILQDHEVGPDRMLDDLRRISQIVKGIDELSLGGRKVLWSVIERSPALSNGRTHPTLLSNQHEETS